MTPLKVVILHYTQLEAATTSNFVLEWYKYGVTFRFQRILPVWNLQRFLRCQSSDRARGGQVRPSAIGQMRDTWLRLHRMLGQRVGRAGQDLLGSKVVPVRHTHVAGSRPTLPQGLDRLSRSYLSVYHRWTSTMAVVDVVVVFVEIVASIFVNTIVVVVYLFISLLH